MTLNVWFKRLVVTATLLGLATLGACLGDSDAPGFRAQGLVGDIPDVQLHKAEFTEVKDGVKEWQLRAGTLEYERDSGLGKLTQVEVTFYPGKGEPVIVRSERGTFDSRAKEIKFIGNVRGLADPYRLYSETLDYVSNEKVLKTEDAARLESSAMRVAGTGLRYDLASREFSVGNDVKALTQQHLF